MESIKKNYKNYIKRNNAHSIDTVFVLVLLCTFAVAVLMVLMLGASSYKSAAAAVEQNYETRTAAGYIAEKVRHSSTEGSIGTGVFDGRSALLLAQEADGETYITYIYCYDGWIRELFTEEDSGLTAEAGEKLLEASDMQVSQDPLTYLIKVTCTMKDGTVQDVLISPRVPGGFEG